MNSKDRSFVLTHSLQIARTVTVDIFLQCSLFHIPQTLPTAKLFRVLIMYNVSHSELNSSKTFFFFLSKTDADYISLVAAFKSMLKTKFMMSQSNACSLVTSTIKTGNQSAFYMLHNSVGRKGSNFTSLQHHFLRSLLTEGVLEVSYLLSAAQKADIFSNLLQCAALKQQQCQLVQNDQQMSGGGTQGVFDVQYFTKVPLIVY